MTKIDEIDRPFIVVARGGDDFGTISANLTKVARGRERQSIVIRDCEQYEGSTSIFLNALVRLLWC